MGREEWEEALRKTADLHFPRDQRKARRRDEATRLQDGERARERREP